MVRPAYSSTITSLVTRHGSAIRIDPVEESHWMPTIPEAWRGVSRLTCATSCTRFGTFAANEFVF